MTRSQPGRCIAQPSSIITLGFGNHFPSEDCAMGVRSAMNTAASAILLRMVAAMSAIPRSPLVS